MSVSILYVTFLRDLHWLRYSLESIRKYATGFSKIVIVVPTTDVEKFYQFERYSTPDCPVYVKGFLEYPGKGFVHHLAMKCYGDVFCDTDYVLHLDPDCLFHEPVRAQDYFVGKKPTMIVEPYELLKQYFPGRYHWKSVTEMALKFDCPYETMCAHPMVYDRGTYYGMREYIEETHGTPFIDFVIKQKNSYPMGFGEFNTLGSWSIKFVPQAYHILDCGPERLKKLDEIRKNPELKIGLPHQKLTQFWSYHGTAKYINEINKILC